MKRSRPLRRTLIIAIVVLIAVLSTAIGAFSTISLKNRLVERLDSQLIAVTDQSFERFGPPAHSPTQHGNPLENREATDAHQEPPMPPNGSVVLDTPGLREGTISGTVEGGSVTFAQVITGFGELRVLTEAERMSFDGAILDGQPQTVQVGSLGSYRAIIREAVDGSGEALLMGVSMAETESTVKQLIVLVSVAGVTAIIVAIFAGVLIVRFALRPLNRIATTARAVSTMRLDHGEVNLPFRVAREDADPSTEAGQVGEALNTLLDHVANALTARYAGEERLRQFVADASHELRTPLAAIRGYAELTSRSPHPVPADIAHALRRIESESVRMTSLVEDLLLLARLDEGERYSNESVDLSVILVDAVSDARAAGPNHQWELLVPSEPVLVRGNAMRLHQVIANLLSNARVHTPDHTCVTATLRTAENAAVLEVRDTGPGIPEAMMPTLFERFVRGDSSRSRHAGSTGLGLAITAALVHAHGGSVHVESQPGNTVFLVTIPLAQE